MRKSIRDADAPPRHSSVRPMTRRLTPLLLTLFAAPVAVGGDDADFGTEGFTEPYRVAAVAAAESGVLAELRVRPGERVGAGRVLAVLDAGVLGAAKTIAEADAAATAARDAAAVELRLKERRLAALRELSAAGIGNAEEVERAVADVDLAAAAVRRAGEELRRAALEVGRIAAQLDRRSVRAPWSGTVVSVAREAGEAVSASDPVVLTLADLTRLRCVFLPSTADAARLRPGGAVTVSVRDASPGGRKNTDGRRTVAGTVEFVSPVTDAESDTVRVEVVLPNTDGSVRSGVRCRLTGGPDSEASRMLRSIRDAGPLANTPARPGASE